MKILVKNSSMIFQKTSIIEKSITKAFTQSDIGNSGLVNLNLTDVPAKPNLPLEIKVIGDSGVVAADTWNLYVNGQASTTIKTNGDTITVNRNELIYSVEIRRASISAAGSITLSVKYVDNPNYEPSETIEQNVEFDSEHTEEVIGLESSAAAPVWIDVSLLGENVGAGFYVSLLDSGNNVISDVITCIPDGNINAVSSQSTPVSKIKIARAGSATGQYTIKIVVP